MRIAVVYVRQSRYKDYERTVSPDVQRESCAALPPVKACDRVDLLQDLDLSGGKLAGRKAFLSLLDRVRRGEVNVIAAYDQSRAFRNTRDALEFYGLLNEHPEVEVVFVQGRFDRSAVGGFNYTALAAAHELERRMTGEKIKASKRHQAALGQMVGAVPSGYVRRKVGNELRVEIDEPAAVVVRRIFADYAAGDASTQDIARRLNLEGVRLPSFKTGWRRDTVAQVLANPAYISRTYTERRSKRQGDVVAAQWLPIVEVATWDAVQRKLARFRHRGGRRDQATGKERAYAFQGLLRCMSCGGPMHCHWLKGRAYYQCRGERANGCRGVRDDALREWARGLMSWIEGQAEIRVAWAEPKRRERPSISVERIDQSIERLGLRFEWGDIDGAAYRAKLADYRALRAEAVAELERAHAAQTPRAWPTNLVDTWEQVTPASNRRLLAHFFDELDVEGRRIVGCKMRPLNADLADIIGGYRGSSPGGIRTRDLSLERAAS
jgi:DNA invertase Pin-like site-specific DNA recombinase